MARLNVRIPDELKQRMDEEEEINWSEYIRKSLRERLGNPGSREIQKLVADYQGDLERLWILHMFAERISKRYVYETAEDVFGEEMDSVVDDVQSDLDDLGIENLYHEAEDGFSFAETILGIIASNGRNEIENQVTERILAAPREIQQGVFLLTYYTRERLDRQSAFVNPEGLERTWELATGEEHSIDELVETGLIYQNYYSSNAYDHWYHRVPDYGLELIEELIDNPNDFGIYESDPCRATLSDLLDDDQVREFLRWMEGSTHYIETYNERVDIEDELSKNGIDLTIDEFESVRERLVNDHVLVIDYSPHRSSAGGRSSRPARWVYRLTDPAMGELSNVLLESI